MHCKDVRAAIAIAIAQLAEAAKALVVVEIALKEQEELKRELDATPQKPRQ